MIRTIHGRGYQFLAPVEEPEARAAAPALPDDVAPVGREAELERLVRLHDLAGQGRRQVAFVTGEAGIGKTTLVEAFAGEVGRGAGGAGRPWPVSRAAGCARAVPAGLRRASAACARSTPGRLALLSRVAPTWLAQMPALVEPADRADLERRALGGTRERMLREAAEALEAAGSDRPLVLVLGGPALGRPLDRRPAGVAGQAGRPGPAAGGRHLPAGRRPRRRRPDRRCRRRAPAAGAGHTSSGSASLGPQAVAAVLGRGLPRGRRPRGAGPARAPANRRGPAVRRPARPGLDRRRRPAAGVGPLGAGAASTRRRSRGPRRSPPPARAPARTAGRRRPRHAGGGRGRRRGVRRRDGRGRRARDCRCGRGAVRGARPPRPVPAAHRPGGLAGRDRVVGLPALPTTSTGRSCTTGSRPAAGRGSMPPSPGGCERAYGPAAAAHAAELATHFLEGRDHRRAVGYLQAAAAAGAGSQRPPRGHPAPGRRCWKRCRGSQMARSGTRRSWPPSCRWDRR